MGIFLNSIAPFEAYREAVSDPYFVDKSLLLTELIPAFGKKNRYFCITRPRRFGKSVIWLPLFSGKEQIAAQCFAIYPLPRISAAWNI